MADRDELEILLHQAIVPVCTAAPKGSHLGGLLFSHRQALVEAARDAILASDWLRDTLAAERERCAKVAERIVGTHGGELDMKKRIIAAIRNLEPEASDEI